MAAFILAVVVGFIYLFKLLFPLDIIALAAYIGYEMYRSSKEKGEEE
ncbi:hypothetical protein [Telluribacter humicola]|nr:hypothetical protein [Telluribacter humicola]